jgi:hypothetical protein
MYIYINENLRGEIKFLAQTGMFTVPIRCEIKKVEVNIVIKIQFKISKYLVIIG